MLVRMGLGTAGSGVPECALPRGHFCDRRGVARAEEAGVSSDQPEGIEQQAYDYAVPGGRSGGTFVERVEGKVGTLNLELRLVRCPKKLGHSHPERRAVCGAKDLNLRSAETLKLRSFGYPRRIASG